MLKQTSPEDSNLHIHNKANQNNKNKQGLKQSRLALKPGKNKLARKLTLGPPATPPKCWADRLWLNSSGWPGTHPVAWAGFSCLSCPECWDSRQALPCSIFSLCRRGPFSQGVWRVSECRRNSKETVHPSDLTPSDLRDQRCHFCLCSFVRKDVCSPLKKPFWTLAAWVTPLWI